MLEKPQSLRRKANKIGERCRVIHIETDSARAEIAVEGAELKQWAVAGQSLIWQPVPAVWPETAPILFPVVGWTRNARVRVGEKSYPLGLHGFARHRTFDIIEETRSSVRLQLRSDAATRVLYPFEFELIVGHRLTDASIATILTVRNKDDRAMPYACGVHPGFRWPFAGGAPETYVVRFDEAENPDVPMIAPGGLIGAEKKHLPLKANVLPLEGKLFENDALCFLDARSHGLSFEAPNGAAIRLDTEDFPHLALWCRPGYGFLCLEAWTGFSDPADFAGDLFAKPSMRLLAPGASARHAATYSYLPAR
jgi:galactose mutarotase-like enzyme